MGMLNHSTLGPLLFGVNGVVETAVGLATLLKPFLVYSQVDPSLQLRKAQVINEHGRQITPIMWSIRVSFGLASLYYAAFIPDCLERNIFAGGMIAYHGYQAVNLLVWLMKKDRNFMLPPFILHCACALGFYYLRQYCSDFPNSVELDISNMNWSSSFSLSSKLLLLNGFLESTVALLMIFQPKLVLAMWDPSVKKIHRDGETAISTGAPVLWAFGLTSMVFAFLPDSSEVSSKYRGKLGFSLGWLSYHVLITGQFLREYINGGQSSLLSPVIGHSFMSLGFMGYVGSLVLS